MTAVRFPGERECHAWLDADDFDGPGEDSWLAPPVGEEPGLAPGGGYDEPGPGNARPDEDGLPALGFGAMDAGPAMGPGTSLHMLAEYAVGGLAAMGEDEVIELIAAARRLRSRAEWLEAQATAEFAERRWEAGPAKGPRRRPGGRLEFTGRAAEFAPDEIAFRLIQDQGAAQEDMELSLALRRRLPGMSARLAAGDADLHRCRIVGQETAALSDEDARLADEMLAPDAGGLRYGMLRRRARKIAMMLDPDAGRERRDRATRKRARVEVFPEGSGNHAFAGRELPAEEALACDAYVKGMARHLKAHGVPGTLREIEVMAYLDLCQGRDPRARIPSSDHAQDNPPAGSAPGSHGSGKDAGPGDGSGPHAKGSGHGDHLDTRADGGRDSDDGESAAGAGYREPRERDWRTAQGWQDQDWDDYEDDAGASDADGPDVGDGPWPFSPPGLGKPGGRAPFPAKINLLVPAGSLLGWSAMPGEAGREITGPKTLRGLVQAASHHPATRWCVTLIGTDRTAIAHGCARGQHAWNPEPAAGKPGGEPGGNRDSGHEGPGSQAAGPPGEDTASGDGPVRARDGTRAPVPVRHARDPESGRMPADAPEGEAAGRDGPGQARDDTRAAVPGRHARYPESSDKPGCEADGGDGSRPREGTGGVPAPAQQAQLADLLARLSPDLEPIATEADGHARREDGYRPSRKLQDMIRARNATCPAPGCGASSVHSDIDHTTPWPQGDTDEANLGPPCRHHHRAKQAPSWQLTQPAPGEFRWQTPTGHVYHVGPTRYDI